MARPRKLPDADVLHQLRIVEALPYEEIATRYGVTKAAVHLALRKSHLVNPRPRYDKELPWTVSVEHSNTYEASQLRIAARIKRGKYVPEGKLRYAENWIKNLSRPRPGAPLGVVLDYDRDYYPEGFAYVPREPSDDWIIRQPEADEEPPAPRGKSGKVDRGVREPPFTCE